MRGPVEAGDRTDDPDRNSLRLLPSGPDRVGEGPVRRRAPAATILAHSRENRPRCRFRFPRASSCRRTITTRRITAMPELQIIGGPQSNYVRVARIACAEKGVPYTLVPVMPHTPEVDAIHPFGKIPVMRHGDVTLSESRAICFYIDNTFEGPPLAPRHPVDGARTEEWISLVNTTIDPLLMRQYLAAYFFPRTQDGRPNRARPSTRRCPRWKSISRCSTASSPRPATWSVTVSRSPT